MELSELVIRESVRQTLADYTAATGRFDLSELAASFTVDGTLEFTGGGEPLIGPKEIEAGLAARLSDSPHTSGTTKLCTTPRVQHPILVSESEVCRSASRTIKVDGFAPVSLMNTTG